MPTILVVEDEPIIREFVCDELMASGYHVHAAQDADAAKIILEGNPTIELIFTDIDMPGSMDGLKLAALVRNRWPPVKIVIASGKRQPLSAEMPTESVFLPKPYLPSEILSLLNALVGIPELSHRPSA
jgi:two-component system, response regulator PdtaR